MGGSKVKIAIIGTGFIGSTLGTALARSGHEVVFGSRDPEQRAALKKLGAVKSVPDALSGAEVIILTLRGGDVADFSSSHADTLAGKLVIDATNNMGAEVQNNRRNLPPTIRYARAFNTLGGEVMADPIFADGRADMFFSAPLSDRATVEAVIEGVGLRPIFVGEDREELIDALFLLWITLAVQQGRGRRLALRLLEG
jgi:predicted dinucleotide-binding enzyme